MFRGLAVAALYKLAENTPEVLLLLQLPPRHTPD